MRKVIFVVQNETHAWNFEAIIRELLMLGIPENKLQVLHLDPIFGLSTRDLISVPNQRTIDIEIPAPYYYLDRLNRLCWILGASSQIKKEVQEAGVLVIGCDGGIQRLMANIVRSRGGKVIMLHDGLLHPWHNDELLKYLTKRAISRIAAAFNLNHLVPSDIGHSNLDLIYVMNSTVKEVLINQGIKTPVQVAVMPRFHNYVEKFKQLRAKHTLPANHLLYATGAYKWHGLFKKAKQQEQDLVDLTQFAMKHPDWVIRIRVHPRDRIEDYTYLKWPANVEISHNDRTALEDLAWASVLVTVYSTVAVEAEMVGVPVLIYTRNFGPPEGNSYFAQNNYFMKSNNLEQVLILKETFHPVQEVECSARKISETILEFLYDC